MSRPPLSGSFVPPDDAGGFFTKNFLDSFSNMFDKFESIMEPRQTLKALKVVANALRVSIAILAGCSACDGSARAAIRGARCRRSKLAKVLPD